MPVKSPGNLVAEYSATRAEVGYLLDGRVMKSLDHCGDRSVIIKAMVNAVARNEGRNNHGRDTWSVLVECESVLIDSEDLRGVSWCDGPRWSDVIVKSAIFLPSDDQQAGIPDLRASDGLVCGFNQGFAACNVIKRVSFLCPATVYGNTSLGWLKRSNRCFPTGEPRQKF